MIDHFKTDLSDLRVPSAASTVLSLIHRPPTYRAASSSPGPRVTAPPAEFEDAASTGVFPQTSFQAAVVLEPPDRHCRPVDRIDVFVRPGASAGSHQNPTVPESNSLSGGHLGNVI